MVCVEFAHNPYLIETSILLNGHSPKKNSAIERYEKSPLIDWVDKVPDILRNEMNGYDFELDFSGADSDFEELQKAFLKADVSEDMVHLFHQSSLEGVDEKRKRIFLLLDWLREHRNRQFDFDSFVAENPNVFETNLPFILLHGEPVLETSLPLSAEVIADVHDLDGTDLTNTPILIRASADIAQIVRADVTTLLERADVKQKQLFFAISPTLNKGQTVRTLMDLGVEKPQVITSLGDADFLRFIDNYPLSDQVRFAISAFRDVTQSIRGILDDEEERNAHSNVEDKQRIQEIEEDIERLKTAEEYFSHLPNLDEPDAFFEAKRDLLEVLSQWKNKKTKLTGEEVVRRAAEEYEKVSRDAFSSFIDSVSREANCVSAQISNDFKRKYKRAGIDLDFSAKGISLQRVCSKPVPEIATALMDATDLVEEPQKMDFFGLFGFTEADEDMSVLVTTCYLERWRDEVTGLFTSLSEDLLNGWKDSIDTHRHALANSYGAHVISLMEQKKNEKERLLERLSDDEKLIQADEDWLVAFQDQLQEIERA